MHFYNWTNFHFRTLSLVDKDAATVKKQKNERIRNINDALKHKVDKLDSRAWFIIRSTFTTIERDEELNEEESEEIENILKAVLSEVHDLNGGPRWSEARIYQKQ